MAQMAPQLAVNITFPNELQSKHLAMTSLCLSQSFKSQYNFISALKSAITHLGLVKWGAVKSVKRLVQAIQLTFQGKLSSETFNIDDKRLFVIVFDDSCVHFGRQSAILHPIISLNLWRAFSSSNSSCLHGIVYPWYSNYRSAGTETNATSRRAGFRNQTQASGRKLLWSFLHMGNRISSLVYRF
jgi:hypothetical protein